ncbi:hypothetical protein Acr_18g0007630 [Actinidia rufa]|uniref:Integrase catalytic domain-containing protein n=1 Tax=Actinidia rufa TaxID=165716 RepID=A0A7J0G732_9ERIC|nr:hypothetical protein Acr_18g0007630 [Actinidia rufa]
MVAYLDEVKAMSGKIGDFKIRQILREENRKADALANLASSFDFFLDRSIPKEFLASPSIWVTDTVFQAEEGLTWMVEIFIYLQNDTLPQDKLHARRIQYRDFLWKYVICKFGIPKVIISDNAKQFDNDKFRLFCSDLAISHYFSSPGHPQANKQVKVTNRIILRNLKARLERSKSEWVEELPNILWAYQTTCRIPIGEMPYSMVFGMELVIIVEIGMPSFRTSNFSKENNETKMRLNLNLLDEKREKANLHQATFKMPCRQIL